MPTGTQKLIPVSMLVPRLLISRTRGVEMIANVTFDSYYKGQYLNYAVQFSFQSVTLGKSNIITSQLISW